VPPAATVRKPHRPHIARTMDGEFGPRRAVGGSGDTDRACHHGRNRGDCAIVMPVFADRR
jgi:hypothetical protein